MGSKDTAQGFMSRRKFAMFYMIFGLLLWLMLSWSGAVSYAAESWSGEPFESRRLLDENTNTTHKSSSATPLEKGKEWLLCFYVGGVAYMFLALGVVVDEFFVPALEEIADGWELTPDIAGATLMAAGGSAPELFTSLIATFEKSDVGFGTIVGSAVFNVLFVIGTVAVMSKTELKLTWWPLFRDCVYYTLSLSTLAVFFSVTSDGKIVWWEALILLSMYGGYVFMMKHNQKLRLALLRCMGKDDRDQVENVAGDVELTEPQMASGRKEIRQSLVGSADFSAELESGSAIVIATMTHTDGDSADGESSDQIAPLSVGRPKQVLTASMRRPSTFRAGLLRVMISDKALSETAGILAVTQVAGDVEATFNQIDADKDGFITKKELSKLIDDLTGKTPSLTDIDQLFKDLDVSKNGKVQLKEFRKWYLESEERLKSDVSKLFNKYSKQDENNVGHMDTKHFAQMMSDLGSAMDVQEIKEVIQTLDTNKNGLIEEPEFLKWYETSSFYTTALNEGAVEADVAEGIQIWDVPETTRARISWLVCLPLMVTLVYSLPDVRLPNNSKYKYWGFFGSIVWIGGYSWFMVKWATIIGATLGIPDAVMGLTFLAAGTSVPDLLSSVVVALKGEGDMAVSSSIGSNIFDVLIGLPFPWLLFNIIEKTPVTVYASNLARSILVLIGMLVAVVTLVMLSGWKITKTLGYSMFVLYGLFVLQDLAGVYGYF
jgi:K+-dependent Na+/Ca+ exchanger-like protein